MVKENKTLDEKTAALWLQNTGQESDEDEYTEPVTESDTEQVTDTEEKAKASNKKKKRKNPLVADSRDKLTERFELKMSPLQMKRLEEIADKYDKHKSEVMRTAFEYFLEQLNN